MNLADNLGELTWDILMWRQETNSDSRQAIRKEIIGRCPEFETKLDEDQTNLVHLASEYGYVQIVKESISISTIKNRASPFFRYDKYFKTPLDYAAIKGNMEIVQLLLNALSFSPFTSGEKTIFMEEALYSALIGNQRQTFRALAIKYMEMENWDSNIVEIIKTTNKLLLETPRLSDDVRTEVFETLNIKLLSIIQYEDCLGNHLLEKFLVSDPLLFRALSTRSCPLETQFYICVLTRQTDDLLDEIYRFRYEYESDEDREQENIYPMHYVSAWGYFHIAKLILIYQSGSSTVCLLKDMDGNTPLHCAAQNGRVSIINMLLSTCWECAGMVSDEKNETALHCALTNNKAKAFKTLLEWYIIKEEFSNNNARDWECGDSNLDLLVDGYVIIVKELLCQRESKICFQREFGEGKEYFVVIKCKKNQSIGTSFKYQDYIREVTSKTTNQTILSLLVDSRSIVTLKILIRSAMVKGILGIRDVDGKTVLDLVGEGKTTNVMGFVEYQSYENVIWLLDAIQIDDYEVFSKLQVEDPQVLDYVCALPLGGTPLHIAVRTGQLNDCTREIIRQRPNFMTTEDHKGRNPLHIAAAKGYLEVVKELVTQMCFSQCFGSPIPVKNRCGEFFVTPLDLAIKRGKISVINELLPIWWKCVGVASREQNSDLLRTAIEYRQYEALKMLMERYIEDELLKAKEVDRNPMSSLADGYIKIVKHLLSTKVGYSLSILVKNREGPNYINGRERPLPLYFAVITVANSSGREGSNIIDELELSAYYPKYFSDVTVRKKRVLHFSMDDENSVTLKLLLRSPLFYQDGGWTIFQILNACLRNEEDEDEDEMETLIPIWSNKIGDTCRSCSINVYDDAKEQLGEDTKAGHEVAVADGNEAYENVLEHVKADHKNDNDEENDIEEPQGQEVTTGASIPVRPDGCTMRDQDRILFSKDQSFASLEECRNAIKDAAILSNTEVEFSKSTGERIVAACSDTSGCCKWKIRAKSNGCKRSNYVVTEIQNAHTCQRLNLKVTTNKLATPTWVSSHIIDKVRQDHNITTQEIKHIMKQSKFQIDINCKTAERAKKRALDTIHEVSKKQRQNLIASSSVSLNAHHQSPSNLRFWEQIPEPMQEYINNIVDVKKDGHCGYRVVAMQAGYEAKDGWKQVRRLLLKEVVQNEELYVKLMDSGTVAKMRKAFEYSEDLAADTQYWLNLPDAGYVIANAFKAVVISLSLKSGNLTFLPLSEPPPEGQPHNIIAFGFVNGNHFINLDLKPDAPIPQVDRRWDTNVSKAAVVWKTPYLNRIEKFKEIMGFELGQTGEGKNFINLEENLQSPPRGPATRPEDTASSAKECGPENSSVTAHRELQILNRGSGVLQGVSNPLGACALEVGSLIWGWPYRDTDATSRGADFYRGFGNKFFTDTSQADTNMGKSERHAGEILNSRKRTRVLIDTSDEFNTSHSETTPTQHHQSPDRAISTPNSLKGKATWFTFTGSATASTLYGCADFVSVYNFPVSPEQTDFYKWIVEMHGHIASVEVISERNTLIMSTRTLIDTVLAIQKLGEACPSEENWAVWKEAIKLPRILKFNIAWLESLLAAIEERRNFRRQLLHVEIAQLEEEVAESKRKLIKHQATQLRLATEAAAVVLEIEATKSNIDVKIRSLAKKNNDLGALS
ncbi:uncharacterized protein LOC113332556 isoform X1 [Papaver somniferum]|uniref:uncharacterized protein LOC113332556 isoform X1 n=2 Tax=Papaver somniferum TaxID=3469 RepID=UPI000E6F4994|nr:uncharacterized protein LOC113332556 isoform X1 [Papaver somniferum]